MSETSGGAPKDHACVSIRSSSLVEVCQLSADCGAAGRVAQRCTIDVDGRYLHCCGAAPRRFSSHARSRRPRRRRRWEGWRWGWWSRGSNRRTWRWIWLDLTAFRFARQSLCYTLAARAPGPIERHALRLRQNIALGSRAIRLWLGPLCFS
jgi:hypothetical protein